MEVIFEQNKNKLTFRLKAVIGWARPSGHTGIFTTMTEDQQLNVLDAISESYVTLNLTPTTHEFDIDEMGRVNFTINYLITKYSYNKNLNLNFNQKHYEYN